MKLENFLGILNFESAIKFQASLLVIACSLSGYIFFTQELNLLSKGSLGIIWIFTLVGLMLTVIEWKNLEKIPKPSYSINAPKNPPKKEPKYKYTKELIDNN